VLLVAPEATAALRGIKQPVAVVAIMGVARSGKSTFLNHALELLVSKHSTELIAAGESGGADAPDRCKTFKTGDTCKPALHLYFLFYSSRTLIPASGLRNWWTFFLLACLTVGSHQQCGSAMNWCSSTISLEVIRDLFLFN
jgi:hypothetical protein